MKVLNNKLQVLAAQLEQQHHQVEASCEKLGQVRCFLNFMTHEQGNMSQLGHV